MIVSDLRPSKPYHLRVISKDGAGNETKSQDHAEITGRAAEITGRATESVLDLIIVNLQESFGWLGNLGKIFR
ncbi:hypothetical protein B5M47_01095 [candidate division CPR3 bacterium 4484_211]|uniref:Fibronectin type-III domain-containing protein n=1 Tax=candidate division CPR3 bacterium 4484_211 TaxID=1968527 RepID=A0A1W9NZ47_UNCC3|nr:MAG: hypothetical protein B5M47_01095 [candidate division CPR3 bacterium 4484_211]